jgi:hypothetical protein
MATKAKKSARKKTMRSAGKRGAATRARAGAKRAGARKSASGRAGARKSAGRAPARRKASAKKGKARKQSTVARVKRVAREVMQQATGAVTAGVETLKDVGGNLVERARPATESFMERVRPTES